MYDENFVGFLRISTIFLVIGLSLSRVDQARAETNRSCTLMSLLVERAGVRCWIVFIDKPRGRAGRNFDCLQWSVSRPKSIRCR